MGLGNNQRATILESPIIWEKLKLTLSRPIAITQKRDHLQFGEVKVARGASGNPAPQRSPFESLGGSERWKDKRVNRKKSGEKKHQFLNRRQGPFVGAASCEKGVKISS